MSKRTTLVLAILLFILLGWAIFGATPPTKESPVPSLFLEFQREEAKSVDLKTARGEIHLERDGKDPELWRVLVGKALVRASSEKVEELLNELSRLVPKNLWRAKEVQPAERAAWGLDAPTTTVKIGLPAGVLRADFGKHTPESMNIYAEKDRNGDVLVVPVEAVAAMGELDPGSLRERFPVKVSSYDVAEFSLRRADGARLEAVRSGAGIWEARAPWRGAVDPKAMDGLLASFLGAEVVEFAADGTPDLDRYGLMKPRATVSLRRRGREGLTVLLVGGTAEGGGTWFMEEGEPSVYVGKKGIGDAVDAFDAAALRDRNALRLGWARLEAIEFEAGPASWKLLRVGEKRWDLERPARVPAEDPAVEELLDALRRLEVVRFVDGGDLAALGVADAASAAARLVITGVDADSGRHLLLGPKDADGNVPARLMPRPGEEEPKGSENVFLLPGSFLDGLAGGALSFRSREAWHIDLEEVASLSRTMAGRTETFLLAGGAWSASEGGPAPDSEALAGLLPRLLVIRGTGWEGKAADAPPAWGHGDPPAGPVIRIGLKTADGAVSERVLTRGAGVDDGGAHYAKVDGTDLVFRLADNQLADGVLSPFWEMLTGPLSK